MAEAIVEVRPDDHPEDAADKFAHALLMLGIPTSQIVSNEPVMRYRISTPTAEQTPGSTALRVCLIDLVNEMGAMPGRWPSDRNCSDLERREARLRFAQEVIDATVPPKPPPASTGS